MTFVKGASPKAHGGILAITEIDRQRLAIGVSIEALCAEADVSARGYYRQLRGIVTGRRLTRSKLTKALGRLAKESLAP